MVLVAGNHEFYCGLKREKVKETIKTVCSLTGVVFLDNSLEFIGTTLWSDIDDKANINDFPIVFKSKQEYRDEFQSCLSFLEKKTEEKSVFPRVIVTHHLPCFEIIHPKFGISILNTAFASHILDQIDLDSVVYWFCGHTHEGGTYNFRKTTLSRRE